VRDHAGVVLWTRITCAILRRCPFDQTMNAFIGRRTRPSSMRWRVLLDDDVVGGARLVTVTAGGAAGTAGRETQSTVVDDGVDQRLVISAVSELVSGWTAASMLEFISSEMVGVSNFTWNCSAAAASDDDTSCWLSPAQYLSIFITRSCCCGWWWRWCSLIGNGRAWKPPNKSPPCELLSSTLGHGHRSADDGECRPGTGAEYQPAGSSPGRRSCSSVEPSSSTWSARARRLVCGCQRSSMSPHALHSIDTDEQYAHCPLDNRSSLLARFAAHKTFNGEEWTTYNTRRARFGAFSDSFCRSRHASMAVRPSPGALVIGYNRRWACPAEYSSTGDCQPWRAHGGGRMEIFVNNAGRMQQMKGSSRGHCCAMMNAVNGMARLAWPRREIYWVLTIAEYRSVHYVIRSDRDAEFGIFPSCRHGRGGRGARDTCHGWRASVVDRAHYSDEYRGLPVNSRSTQLSPRPPSVSTQKPTCQNT